MTRPDVPATENGVSPGSLRAGNLARILREIYGANPELSRAQVAARTNLTRSTVSRLVDELIAGGLVAERTPSTGKRGRPAVPLTTASGTFGALGLEMNVGHISACVLDLRGDIVSTQTRTADYGCVKPKEALAALATLAHRCLGEASAKGLTVVQAAAGFPGIVDDSAKVVLWAPNLGWSEVPVASALPCLGDIPLTIDNEANLAALTIAEPVTDGEYDSFIYLSSEVGIGGAIVCDGHVMRGEHGWCGELGHISIDPLGPPCRCGSRGCLEQYAGMRALLATAGHPDASPEDFLAYLDAGDTRAISAVQSAGRALGLALAGVMNVLDVKRAIIGGYLGLLMDSLAPHIEHELRTRVVSARWVDPQVSAVWLDEAPAATGGALLGLSQIVTNPIHWLSRSARSPG